jgi:hypothetical protein
LIERRFGAISLADLNAKAEMLTRLDNKYVVSLDALDRLAPALGAHFDILEIDGKRCFGYHTQYFDTPEMCSFRHHVQGRRRRSKVRTRHYLDADICFVEVKLKSLRKVTVKKRLPHDPGALGQLSGPAMQFVEDAHLAGYERGSLAPYAPVMQMHYDRMTLVARTGGERLTIDRSLRFWNDRAEEAISPEMVVIETKSAFGRGIADTILRGAGYHPVGSCSKYCVGLAALGMVPRFNKFLPAFRRLLPHLAEETGRPGDAGPRPSKGHPDPLDEYHPAAA